MKKASSVIMEAANFQMLQGMRNGGQLSIDRNKFSDYGLLDKESDFKKKCSSVVHKIFTFKVNVFVINHFAFWRH